MKDQGSFKGAPFYYSLACSCPAVVPSGRDTTGLRLSLVNKREACKFFLDDYNKDKQVKIISNNKNMVASNKKPKTLKAKQKDKKGLAAVIKEIDSVVCPKCKKPVWSNLGLQLKKLEGLLKKSSLPKVIKEEAFEFLAEIIGKAESYYLKKFSRRQYHWTPLEEKTWEKFQNKKEIQKISDKHLVEVLEKFPIIADWLSIPESHLSFKQKKDLLLILRKI